MQSILRGWRGVCAAVVVSALAGNGPVAAQDQASFEKRLTVHTLANGYTFLILERPGAPVFSFATRVDVGSAQEVPGITGLAHMFEHMAFKGTPRLGTKDFAKEKVAIDELEASYMAYERARAAVKPDQAEVDRLLKAFKEKEAAAQDFVVANAFDDAVSREGGVGLNAGTSAEATTYYYSLPTNKFELFAYLESERFLHPVFREFYKERDVVMEERRQRTESQPIGKLVERMLATAFLAHPYKQPTVGYMSDLQRFTMTDAEAVLPQVLRAGQHGHGHRRQRESGRDHPGPREVLRPPAEGREAGAAAHAGAAAGRRTGHHAAGEGAAHVPRGLPPAVGPAPRRRHLRRDCRRSSAVAGRRACTSRWSRSRSSPCRPRWEADCPG